MAVYAAGHLSDWPAALRAADRVLDLDRRSGMFALVNVAGTLNLVARGLAEQQQEAAGVLLGVVRGLLSGQPAIGRTRP
jgi:hypothetical protein